MTRLTRRHLMTGLAAFGALGGPAVWTSQARADGPFVQPMLPYGEEALDPVISGRTVGLHYGKHHAGYFRNLNRMVDGTPLAEKSLAEVVVTSARDKTMAKLFNQAGQAWNHILYWEQMVPGGPSAPTGDLAARIDETFGSFEDCKKAIAKASMSVFGSGWGWLVMEEDGSLGVMGTANGDNPLARDKTALVGIDVWEHAYYLDYENRRGEHVKALLDRLINWRVVEERFAA